MESYVFAPWNSMGYNRDLYYVACCRFLCATWQLLPSSSSSLSSHYARSSASVFLFCLFCLVFVYIVLYYCMLPLEVNKVVHYTGSPKVLRAVKLYSSPAGSLMTQEQSFVLFYFAPARGVKYCGRRVCVCLYVCLSVRCRLKITHTS